MILKKNKSEKLTVTKIFVFDLDGTIVFNGKNIEPKILKLLMEINNNHKIIFASARPIRDMLPLLHDFQDNDLIGGNGSMIRSNGKTILKSKISEKILKEIFSLINEFDLDYIIDYDWDYSARIRDKENTILDKLDSEKLANNVELSVNEVSKVILFNISKELFSLSIIKG